MFVLRRDRRTRHQPVVFRLLNQRVEKKLRGTLHHRVSPSKKISIAGKLVVMPQMRAEPCTAGGPETPKRAIEGGSLSPKIGVVMTNPSSRAVMNTRRARPILDQL